MCPLSCTTVVARAHTMQTASSAVGRNKTLDAERRKRRQLGVENVAGKMRRSLCHAPKSNTSARIQHGCGSQTREKKKLGPGVRINLARKELVSIAEEEWKDTTLLAMRHIGHCHGTVPVFRNMRTHHRKPGQAINNQPKQIASWFPDVDHT